MNRRTLAICDPEEAYACRLMDALSRREDFPFEVLAFTGAERLQDSLAQKPVQILLIAQGLFREEMKDWVRHVILLQEEENSPVQELPCVSKYSSVLRIAKKVTETAMQTEKLPFLQTVGKACVYGFYTPVGRSLQTTFALTMGQLLAANKRVLYLNFECCAGLTEMLGKQADNTEFASLLYYLQESKEQFLGRLYQAAECINGMDFILPASCGYDLYGIAREEWRRLLDLLDDGQYDVILLDLSDGVQGLFDVLRRCTRVYTIVREDGFAAAKLAQYRETLERTDYSDVWERSKKLKLPFFCQLPKDIGNLSSGELAEYTKKVLDADEQGGI